MTRITRIKLIMRSTTTVDKPNKSRDTTISRNYRNISNRKIKRSYSVAAAEEIGRASCRERVYVLV